MLPNIFDKRCYINTEVQASDSDLQNSAVAQHLTRYTRQLTNLFYGTVAVTKKVWKNLAVTLWVEEKLNSAVIDRFN